MALLCFKKFNRKEVAILICMRHFLKRFVPALLICSVLVLPAFGLGLGEIRVRSSLGQNLLAHADIIGNESEIVNASCLRARILTMDGVFLASANITVHQNQKKRALSFATKQAINEPAINLVIDINCETQLHREFSILLDPPELSLAAQVQKADESPFSTAQRQQGPDSLQSATNSPRDGVDTATKSKKRARSDAESPRSVAPANPKVDLSNTAKPKKMPAAKDILKLSDEVIVPNLQQGLRMSDVLSTESGKELIQNMEELRIAQTKMAAILRDESPNVEVALEGKGAGEIANLKLQAEQLKKQNLLDKAALSQLQNKPSFDAWLMVLAIVAIVAILIILFLLVYIRRNLTSKMPTWWEDESLSSEIAQPEKIEDVIKNLQASYDSNRSNVDGAAALAEKRNSVPAASLRESEPHVDSDGFKAIPTENVESRTPSLEETNSSIFNFFTPRGSSVKVEEISDVTQEAEFWISMNDPQRAIEILSAQEKVEQPDSPVPWLFLLDLYRTVKDHDKYNQLRDRFIVFFNANIPEYDTDLSQVHDRYLEDFPHLTQRICDEWGGQDIIPYLESLLIDDREGKRSGFDLPVYRDILMLLGIAHELDKIMAIEGPVRDTRPIVPTVPDVSIALDPVTEADFGAIEFEMIDFPKMEATKKSN